MQKMKSSKNHERRDRLPAAGRGITPYMNSNKSIAKKTPFISPCLPRPRAGPGPAGPEPSMVQGRQVVHGGMMALLIKMTIHLTPI
jgi:hypothetical protein